MEDYYSIVKNGGAILIDSVHIYNKNGQITAAVSRRGEAPLTDTEAKEFIDLAVRLNRSIQVLAR